MEYSVSTFYVSEMSITMYSCEKNCENCKSLFEKYCKFLVIKCCGEHGRYCFGWILQHGVFRVKNVMMKEGLARIILLLINREKNVL